MGHPDSDEHEGTFAPGAPLAAGASSIVRGVVLPDGTPAVLKRYRSHRAWRQALGALRDWGPLVGPSLTMPRLLQTEPDGPLTLLVERLPGVRADQPGWRRDSSLASALGRGLRALHDLPVGDDDPLSLERAVTRRMKGWMSRAPRHLEPRLLAAVNARFQPSALAGRRRRPCHRDAEPDNVLVGPDHAVALIDFEHARMDDPLVDIVRTWDGAPLDRSPFTAALVAAWGAPAPVAALRCWGLLHGVATLCTAHEAGLEERAAQAVAFLTQIVQGHTGS